jgi:ribosomal protein S27AE
MALRRYKIKEKCPKCGHGELMVHEEDNRPTVARCHKCGHTVTVEYVNEG